MRLHPGVLCVAFCIGCSCRWQAWRCVRDALRTLRSSCCATNSQSCTARTADQPSPMRTGPCSVRSRRPCRDGNEPAGSSHPTPCCVGIDAESPATGPNPAGRRAGPALLWSCVVSSSAWPPATRHGATAASPANSLASVTALEHPLCGESSNTTASTPQRTSVTWTQFLRSQAAVACDFVTVDTALLRRYYLLFFIDITNREVLYGGITANPTGAWTTQAARNLFVRHPDRFTHTRALVRDRASQFVNDFDEIFRSEGLKILGARGGRSVRLEQPVDVRHQGVEAVRGQSGLRQRSPVKRAKSLSLEWTSAWCSMASAAMWASVTRFPPTPAAASMLRKIVMC